MHERLGVDVLVVLGEIEPAFQRLIDHAAVIAAGQAELRLDRGAEQRAAEFVQPFALDDDAGRRAVEGFHIGGGKAHILQPQCLQRLEAEDVADNRGGDIGDGAGFEQIEIVGDIGEIGALHAGHRVHPVAFGAVGLAGGEPVGPDHGPGGGGGFAGDGGGGFHRVHALLRGDAEQADDVGVLGSVVGLPIAHVAVFHARRRNSGFFWPERPAQGGYGSSAFFLQECSGRAAWGKAGGLRI